MLERTRMTIHVVLLAGSSALACTLAATPAFAQAPPVTFGVTPPGDRSEDAGALWGFSAPLRLTLQGSIFPAKDLFPGCATREDAAGNSVGGIPVQRFTLLRLTPKLVLSGFSQLGCPVDAGIGGTLTYAVPLRPSTWLVFGGGIYGVPAQMPLFGGTPLRPEPPAQAAGKVDFVWSTRGGRAYSVGVESVGRVRQGVTFGGGF